MNHITKLARARSAALARVEALSGQIASTDAEEVRALLSAKAEADAEYRRIEAAYQTATATFTAAELIALGAEAA